jgi:hypothetical protein
MNSLIINMYENNLNGDEESFSKKELKFLFGLVDIVFVSDSKKTTIALDRLIKQCGLSVNDAYNLKNKISGMY